ncbi:hypothetical protein BD414DRAFT_480129 [Trametes punicea]|nr:hypothetical protein BD414DRAFT_480129 [Trametes punicea]
MALNMSWLWLTAPSRRILATENMTWATDHLRTHSLPPESSAKAATRGRHTLYQSTTRSYMVVPPSHTLWSVLNPAFVPASSSFSPPSSHLGSPS